MTIGSAKKFIDQVQIDDDLRRELNRAGSYEVLMERLEAKGFSFSSAEFEDAFNNKHVNCQFQEQANQLQEMKAWWELLQTFLGGAVSSSSCGSCSIKSSCSLGSCSSPK